MSVRTDDTPTTPLPSVAEKRRHSAFLPGLHAFRAIATILVVGQHTAWILSWPPNSTTRAVLADLLDNSTVLFVFLSGFLFAHLAGRHSYLGFLRRRATTVVAPYLIVGLPAAVLAVFLPRVAGPFTEPAGQPAVLRFLWFMLHGTTVVNQALWFIPMIALFYLLSPLFTAFLRYPVLFWLLPPLIVFSVLAHRVTLAPDSDTLSLAAYYVPAYVAGMWASHFRTTLESWARHWWVASAAWLAMLLAQVLFASRHGNYEGLHLFSQENGLLDLSFLQKLLLCLALYLTTHRFAARLGGLRRLGFASFSVYLIHCYLVTAFKVGLMTLNLPTGGLLAWVLTTAAAAGVSLLIVFGIHRLFGRYSIYVIGSAPEPTRAARSAR